MTLNLRLLCGIHAAGDTLSCGGMLLRTISLYLMILAKPCLTFVMASARNAARASLDRALLCGPCWIAASIWACVQFGPQSAGHPLVENSCSNGVAGWFKACVRGHIKPILPILSFMGMSSGIVASVRIAFVVARTISFAVAAGGSVCSERGS